MGHICLPWGKSLTNTDDIIHLFNSPSEHDKHSVNEHVVQFSPNLTVHATHDRPLSDKVVDGQDDRHLPSYR
jgi:hypothetical protein